MKLVAYFILGYLAGHAFVAALSESSPNSHTACEIVQARTNAGYVPTQSQRDACALQRMKELREIDSE